MAKKVDKPWTKCRNSTDRDWTRAFAHDGRDPQLHCEPTRSVDQLCEMCPSPTVRSSTHCSDEEGCTTTHDRVQHRVQFWSGIQCDDQLRDASTQRNLDATNTSVHPDNSSLAPLCREHPSDGKDQSTTGKCSDDGRGLVKKWSRRLARKLQRSASLVNAGFSKQIQSVLDAAVVDRCDFVEICCSVAPCLTEAMQQSGISSSSLLRSDGVENHDAQTREKLLGWFSEKRPQKAWFSPPVIAHQNKPTRCSLRTRQIFRKFFEYAAAVLQIGGHIY